MFKIPLIVVEINERRRPGNDHLLQLSLTENNEDSRINAGEISIALKIRSEDDSDPQNGFERKRFKPGDIWYLVMQEDKKPKTSEPPHETE